MSRLHAAHPGHAARGAARLTAIARLAAIALLAATALSTAWAAPARAADVVFGDPEATATYTEGIEFSVPITTTERPDRVEIRLRYPGGLGPFIEEVPVPATGTQTLTYRLDTSGGGHIVPNTVIEATWAAVPRGGGNPVLSATETVRYADTSQEWRTMRGDLVVVHWYEGGDAFARRALEIGDKAVADIAGLLGVTETEPIDFFIYGDDAAFRTALGPGTRENVGGQAHAGIRTLFAMIGPSAIDDPWVGVVVPHELAHLVLDTAVDNPFRFPPRWMNEGLAVYLSEGYTPTDRNNVADAVDARELLPLTALTGQFPTDPTRTYLAYSESVSAIDHLVRTYGEDALWALVDAYADGLTDDEALARSTGGNMAAFQAGWLEELGAKPPEQYGPIPHPAGPLPPGWDTPAGGGPPGATAAPGAPVPVPTGSPGEATQPPGDTTDDASGGAALPLFVAVAGVVLVVIVALAIARRRSPAS